MPLNAIEKKNAVTMAIKMTEVALSSAGAGTTPFVHPEKVTALMEQLSTKIQELMAAVQP
jgi:hypothetical protein